MLRTFAPGGAKGSTGSSAPRTLAVEGGLRQPAVRGDVEAASLGPAIRRVTGMLRLREV